MNWDAIGAFAELLGALAVFASLIYLATQIKAAANQNRAAMTQAFQSEFSRSQELVASSPDLAQLIDKASSGAELATGESVRLSALVTRGFTTYIAIQIAYDNNQLDRDYFEIVCADVKRLSTDPGWASTVKGLVKRYPGSERYEIFRSLYEE